MGSKYSMLSTKIVFFVPICELKYMYHPGLWLAGQRNFSTSLSLHNDMLLFLVILRHVQWYFSYVVTGHRRPVSEFWPVSRYSCHGQLSLSFVCQVHPARVPLRAKMFLTSKYHWGRVICCLALCLWSKDFGVQSPALPPWFKRIRFLLLPSRDVTEITFKWRKINQAQTYRRVRNTLSFSVPSLRLTNWWWDILVVTQCGVEFRLQFATNFVLGDYTDNLVTMHILIEISWSCLNSNDSNFIDSE